MESLRIPRPALPVILAIVLCVGACEQVESFTDSRRDLTPHEAYLASLSQAGLAGTALVRDWIAASRAAVEGAPTVRLPFQEEGFISADEAGATAYRVHVGRGQRLNGRVYLTAQPDTRVFVDLFRVPEDDADPLRPVLAVDSLGDFAYEPWRGGDFILRIQPELLRGGSYRVVLRLEAQLAFPVEGKDPRAILSGWGAERDAGRRSHEGVDIFARRGTPVLATSDGVVNRVNVTRVGGRVVWLRDGARNANIYFAHLDSQVVRRGQQVRLGDTLGFVGNTGNARTTSPHLHFGIYRRGEGAVDPAPFLHTPSGSLSDIDVDLARLGSWVRMRDEGIRLRAAPGLRTEVRRELARYTPLRVLGGTAEWYRVRLPDGEVGYVAARLTEGLDLPFETRVAIRDEVIQATPQPEAATIASVRAGAELPVLGRFGGYVLVQDPTGRSGWVGTDGSSLP
jgi:murein DD-endopeptidase MepM/ murein hydrolase activator NlpD/SH3-like domain-containing protein